jgi:phenylalanyl-tRNA synthetase beta subunit
MKYKNSKFFEPVDTFSNSFSFSIYFDNNLSTLKKSTPLWISKKLLFYGIESSNFFQDIFTLINLEYGNLCDLKNYEEKENFIKFLINIKELSSGKLFFHQLRFTFIRFLTLVEICLLKKIKTFEFESLSKDFQNIESLQTHNIIELKKENFTNIVGLTHWDLNIFERIGIPILSKTEEKIYFSIPYFRTDIERPIDLIEEYCRFLGYDFFQKDFSFIINNFQKKKKLGKNVVKVTKNYFLINSFQEILTSPLLKEDTDFSLISLKNPLNKDFSHLRSSILDSLLPLYLKGKLKNSLNVENRVFEIGRIFKYADTENNKVVEENHLGGIIEIPIKKKKENSEKDLFQRNWFVLKSIFENYFRNFDDSLINYKKSNSLENYYHPQKTISFYFQEHKLGNFGEIHPRLRKELALKNSCFLFEINLSILKDSLTLSQVKNIVDFSKYPMVIRDISFSISKNLNFSIIPKKLEKEIPLLQSSFYIDIFSSKEGIKEINLSLKCQFQKNTETLTSNEIDLSIKEIYNILEKEFDAKIN